MGDPMKSPTKMEPLLLLILLLVSPPPSTPSQAPFWVNICSGTYLFSDQAQSWNEAYAACELYSGHLLQIDDLAESFCLLDYAHKTEGISTYYWHSANDILSEGVWRQYDEKLISWTPWWRTHAGNYAADPDGGKAQNCAGIYLTEDGFAGRWFDDPCESSYRYICESSF